MIRPPRRRLALAALMAAGCGIGRGAPVDWSEATAIVAGLAEPNIPAARFLVTDYGAVADGRTDCRPAIARAIAQASAAGGGHVELPAGSFFCDGPLRLESRIDLHLAAGCTLRFGADPARYLPTVLSRYEGTLYYGHAARIEAHGARDIAITGQGVIDGNARGTFALVHQDSKTAGELRDAGAAQVPVKDRQFGAGRWLRPSLIEPFDCRNVLVEGVTLKDSTFWIVHPVLCRNVIVRHLQVESMNANNDGCDPDSCSDMLIEDCDFHTGDDSIAIKSGRDRDGWVVGRPTERLVIRRCLMRSRYSALCIGSEMSGGVREVFMEDCRVAGSASAFYFKANLDRGGLVEGIRARRIKVGTVREAVVRFETGYHGYRGGNFPPEFRDFVIEDLTCEQTAAYAVFIEGVAAAPIQEVTLRHVTVDDAKVPTWIRHAEGIHFDGVRINGATQPAVPETTPPSATKLDIKN